MPKAVHDLAIGIVKERYADFGPTLACEKLAQLHNCRVSRETLRQWMIAEGLWLDRRRRLPSVHCMGLEEARPAGLATILAAPRDNL